MIRKKIILFFLILFFFSAKANAQWPFSSGETLHYTLSYRGLLTSFIWADLADVKMTFLLNSLHSNAKIPNQPLLKFQFIENDINHQFILNVSTENFIKAEMIQPVRYTYITTLDAALKKTILVEEIDSGRNQSHYFLWLDWKNKQTQLFKKRELETIKSGFMNLQNKEVWEKDGALGIPDFLNIFPLLENNLSYLIHKESGDKIEYSSVLDPLSLIYLLRTMKINTKIKIPIAVADDIRLYSIEPMGEEELKLKADTYQSTKYKIRTDEKKEHFYYIWLNNDDKKTPLRFAMDAPLGMLKIDLIQIKDCRNK